MYNSRFAAIILRLRLPGQLPSAPVKTMPRGRCGAAAFGGYGRYRVRGHEPIQVTAAAGNDRG
ncbi:MAG: hypothetical protein HP031_00055 [Oscillospiraceae bacterium]|nr:hypothetical protein [Oscillospiraceae bacterium]